MNPVWTTSVVLIGINRNFLPICQSDLISWVGEAVTSSLTPTVSASPSQSPSLSPSSTVVPASPAFSSNPDSYQTEKDLTVSAVESTGSKNKSESIPAVADSQPVSAGVSPDSMQSSASVGKVLSDSANQLKNGRRWVATILAFSVLTGILIAFIEKKYVKN
jgi:hypothetical protein